MGIIEALLGDSTPPEPEESPESTIELAEDEHEVVYPIAVNTSELAAYKSLLEYDRETPRTEGGMPEFIEEAVDEALQDVTPGDQSGQERINEAREEAEYIIDAWQAEIGSEQGIIFMPVGAYFHLSQPLWTCEARAEQDADPFEVTEELLTAASLVQRLKDAEEGDGTAVFAHVDDIPVTQAEIMSDQKLSGPAE